MNKLIVILGLTLVTAISVYASLMIVYGVQEIERDSYKELEKEYNLCREIVEAK